MNRDAFFERLSSRLNAGNHQEDRRAAVETRLANPPVNTVPAASLVEGEARLELFRKQISKAGATVTHVQTISDIAGELARYFKGAELKLSLANNVASLGVDFQGSGLILVPWEEKTSLSVSMSLCFGAVAETGSLAICSATDNPLTLNFLADCHIALVFREDLSANLEALWARVRQTGGMPRDLTLVSGPSCTGDIEMIMEYGAHGPKSLHVIVVDERP